LHKRCYWNEYWKRCSYYRHNGFFWHFIITIIIKNCILFASFFILINCFLSIHIFSNLRWTFILSSNVLKIKVHGRINRFNRNVTTKIINQKFCDKSLCCCTLFACIIIIIFFSFCLEFVYKSFFFLHTYLLPESKSIHPLTFLSLRQYILF